MNKTDLIKAIAEDSGLSVSDAGRVLEAMLEIVKKTLRKGDSISIIGFGTFFVRRRPVRAGRDPRTGRALKIKASNVPMLRASPKLRSSLSRGQGGGTDDPGPSITSSRAKKTDSR